jgi:hypothetical protein
MKALAYSSLFFFTFFIMLGACTKSKDIKDVTVEEQNGFIVHPTFDSAPTDPLAGSDVESCELYLEERCESGTLQKCEIFNTSGSEFVDDPDPLLKRVYLYDRRHDLSTSPVGMTAERVFSGPMPGSATEEEFLSADNFATWAGSGDSGIWTGAALVSDIFRYMVNGTEADYQHMEERVRTLIRSFEVTHIPGYLARYHFLLMNAGEPNSDKLIVEHDAATLNSRDNPIESLDIEGLPDEYTTGIPDAGGNLVTGVPHWNGHTSIDQYSGPMTAFPLVYNLLRDETLKEKIVYHMTCYLKRLRRLEIINLQSNPQVLDEVTKFFAGSDMNLDPDDIDFTTLDKLVVYYHEGFNSANAADYDRTCPENIALTPTRVLDADDPSFIIDMMMLANDLGESDEPAPGQIDHFYIANVRGGDASHLIHLATMAYYFTGDEQYKDFIFDELIDNLNAVKVALTMLAFRLPDFCFKFYGDHITYGTHWQLITMLPESELKQSMIRVMEEELWQKGLWNHHSSKFNIMYASVVPDDIASTRDEAIATAVSQLRDFGGNDGVIDAPRRTYTIERSHVIDNLPAGITVRCPTEDERDTCEKGGDLFGIPLEGKTITYECDGRAGECVMEDGLCVEGIASEGLPPSLRVYADFMWQRSPFDIGLTVPIEGVKQSPGRDLSESYWMARYYDYITEGADNVLAWHDSGTCQ